MGRGLSSSLRAGEPARLFGLAATREAEPGRYWTLVGLQLAALFAITMVLALIASFALMAALHRRG